MDSKLTLEEAIEEVLQYQKQVGHTELYLIDMRRTFNRLIKLAHQHGDIYFSEELASLFLDDSKNSKTGEYCYNRFLTHNRCIRFLRSYLETGRATIEKYHVLIDSLISNEFKKALALYDEREKLSGLSESSLTKNHRPIRYLLEYMTSIGYQQLSDIQHGDTVNAIEDMLEKHYEPTSLVTAISGMRRFYEMFPELYIFRLEIPSRMPRKRSIIDVYTDEEQQKISAYLSSNDISRRDAAICLLSFETGLRSVDICNLKLDDVDWKHDAIYIVQSKTQRPLTLPIRTSYGNAMTEYLLKERPQSEEDYFFLSVNAPHVKLGITWNIIRNAVSSAGIDVEGRLTGTRMFRHNAATSMLKKGVPLPAIAEQLGHKSQDSTMVYLSTDQKKLSLLTLPVPKGGMEK